MWFIPLSLSAQSTSDDQIDWVDSIIYVIRYDQDLDSKTKSMLADSAFQISLRKHDICRQIYTRIQQAIHLDNMGMADSALILLYWASRAYQPKCDSNTLMFLLSNLTNVYLSLGELDRVDSVSRIGLALWNPAWKEKNNKFSIIINLAIAQAMRNDTVSALKNFRQAYYEAEEEASTDYIQKALINLGSLKGMTGDLDSAYFFFNQAADNAKENADMDNYLHLLLNLANVDTDRGRYKQAIVTLDSTYTLADTLKNIGLMAQVEKTRAELFAKMHKYESAYGYLMNYVKVNEQYLDEERVKAVTEMMEKYESEKKARQIQQLNLDKLDATLKNERITHSRNRYLFIGAIILLLAIALWGRLRYVHRSRAAIKHEKDISEGLLLNILPASVAEELKQKGYAEAKLYETATILFSDFKSFTEVSGILSPTELVEEINYCFKSFDEVMGKFGLEKIKTIGDSYMAAGSLPDTNKATALEVVLAGIEMQRIVIERKADREAQQLPYFEMRIGIHSGPVVAGIVGVKKFQYDLWGDTVNIASRMETNSDVGRVNISSTTYELVKYNPGLKFTSRGLIYAKGKGEMEMYFVELSDEAHVAQA
jgi:class 3 adenylate cyclase